MICPVCSTEGRDADNCPQCGSDLGLHRILKNVIGEKPSVTKDAQVNVESQETGRPSGMNPRREPAIIETRMIGTPVTNQLGGRRVWEWLVATVILMILTGFFTWLAVIERSTEMSVVKLQAANVESNKIYFDEFRALTTLLQQTMSMVTEQRRELEDLRAQFATPSANGNVRSGAVLPPYSSEFGRGSDRFSENKR